MASPVARSSAAPSDLSGRDVLNKVGDPIGRVGALWNDHATGRLEFIGVKTGWFSGELHAVPTQGLPPVDARGRVVLPYTSGEVEAAPAFGAGDRITDAGEAAIYRHYGIQKKSGVTPAGVASGETALRGGPAAPDPAAADAADYAAGTAQGGYQETTAPAPGK